MSAAPPEFEFLRKYTPVAVTLMPIESAPSPFQSPKSGTTPAPPDPKVNDKSAVLQLARDVPAGQQLTSDDFRSVEIGSDSAFRSVPAGDINAVVGSYAKVRLIAGTLLAREALQAGPLVAAGASVVAVTVPSGEVPIGLRERSRVSVVMVASDRSSQSVEGQIVGLPTASTSSGQVSVSIELAATDAAAVASAEKVRLVLLDPGAAG